MMIRNRKRKFACAVALAACATLALSKCARAAIPAFSGAEGPGSTATGGRGGDVYHVTNLQFDLTGTIPGSLEYGLTHAPAAGRTIVFDVGGTIYFTSDNTTASSTLRVGTSNITVAGQTAPGPGITIAGVGTKWTGSNVILRNMAVRPGLNSKGTTFDAFSLELQNSIVDHVSASWFTDEGISETDAGQNTTIQYASISEGLNNVNHSFGSIIATEVNNANLSYHHNLYAQDNSRMPRLGSEYGGDRVEGSFFGATANFSNNVMYNWISKAGYSALDVDNGTQQPSSTNMIGNYYIEGASNGTHPFQGAGDETKIYQSGNYWDMNKDGVLNGVPFGWEAYTGTVTQETTPFVVAGVGPADSAPVALERVLDYTGANWQNRNPIEARLVSETRNGTGDLVVAPPTDDWNTVVSQAGDGSGDTYRRAANYDTDKDGMPDIWEASMGLNPTVATGADGNNGSVMNDGYTNLEAYINEVAAWPASSNPVFNNANGTGRFAEIGNWSGGIYKPSRFDTAQIDSGTAKVDVVGQHANFVSIASTANSTATLSVTGGWIDIVQTLSVGPVGTGSVNQSGGIVHAGTSVMIGNASHPGTYTLTSGTLATPLLAKGNSASTFAFMGGTLHANTVNFNLTNQGGILAPGSDLGLQLIAAASMPDINNDVETVQSFVGNTHVAGTLNLQAGQLQIDLASLASFDTLKVDSSLSLGGALGVVLDNGYTPTPGSEWLIGTAGNITGGFASITPGFTTRISGGNLFLDLSPAPEPGSIALLGVASLGLLRRCRRK